MQTGIPAIIAAASVVLLQPLANENILEPSVRNEVDHALSLAPSNVYAAVSAAAARAAAPDGALPPPGDATNAATTVFTEADERFFAVTNGLSATDIALKLVSMQQADGRWFDTSTNDVSAAAVAILFSL